MKIDQKFFDSLDKQGKAILVWEHGEYLLTREYYGSQVNLYALPGFYVEVYYRDDLMRIERIHSIKETEHLEKFLFQIELRYKDLLR